MRTTERTQRILIPTTQVVEGDRVRSDYGDLTNLADSIRTEGLIHPIVVDLNYRLVAGGRRFRAMRDILKLAEVEVNFIETLDDAHLRRLEAEENVRRKEMTWQERVRSVKLVHNHQALKGAIEGTGWTQSMTGQLLGFSQAHVSYALQVATLLDKGDKELNDCDSFTEAIKLLVKRAEDQATAILAKSTLANVPAPTVDATAKVQDILSGTDDIFSSSGPAVGLAARPTTVDLPSDAQVPEVTIPLSSMLFHANSIEWMDNQPTQSIDHIVCDPPYAIEMSNIQQDGGGMDISSTRAEHDVESNVRLLKAFFEPASRILKDRGFLVMWCDFSQWNMLQDLCVQAGLTPQRWPLVWVKTHPCQNMAAQYNFTKNVEIALVARKNGATLVTPQTSCYWQGSGQAEKDLFGHPFAKPTNLWKWIYGAIAIKGQRVLDPFAGSGSSTVAAISLGLQPTAIELNEAHYNRLVVNVSNTYRSMHPNVKFQ